MSELTKKPLEIEKKYLIKTGKGEDFKNFITSNFKCKTSEIVQFYIQEENNVVRYRRKNNIYFKTIKKGSGLVREEIENEISKETHDLAMLSYNQVGKPVSKIRIEFELENFVYEADFFQEQLSSLALLEVEFKSEETANAHLLPNELREFVERDVTEESTYVNQVLALS